ncbi:MAG: ABC transporter ATP-binding protein [Firmicutes bacterium]|nr:ABC transporter ATP-binding protein [Bacillota bacterium]
MERLLEVKDLKTYFNTDDGLLKAVDGVSFYVDEQEIIGVVGESGCGKTVTQLSVMQLIARPGKIVGGEVIFEGRDILKYKPHGEEMRAIRGGKIAMIFQEPMTSLNPVLTLNQQLSESLMLHLKMNKEDARKRAIELLRLVGIPSPEARIDDYPHQFSGGMRQRVMIAMGLSCNPKILIADEPTTALDVTTQAQLLELMTEMVERFRSSLIIVTHNLGVVARYAKRIYIMYAGKIVEEGTCKEIFKHPRHPYTIGLLNSVPRLDTVGKRLVPIEGLPPNLTNMPDYCAFLPRCPYKTEKCRTSPMPDLRDVPGEGHRVRCYVDIAEVDNVTVK